MDSIAATVIIPTYRRTDDVLRCVESLMLQDAHDFEVVVVDNAGEDTLRERISGLPAGRVRVRYVREPELGIHSARHRGAREAASDLLLYVDDDAVCEPTWAGAYTAAFARHPELHAASGPIAPLWDREPDSWLRELALRERSFTPYGLLDLGDRPTIGPDGIFFGGNMAIRRDVLFRVGGFNPEIFGSQWLGDGETGLLRKMRRLDGLQIGWVPDARILHRIPESRMSLSYLRRRASSQGAADSYSQYCSRIPSVATLAKHAVWYAGQAVRALGRLRRTAARPSVQRARAAMDVSYYTACARYSLRLCWSPRLRDLVRRDDWLAEI